jgi:hypothetical protein
MTSRQRQRRSAAVPRKLLTLLVRRFTCGGLRGSRKTQSDQWRFWGGVCRQTPIPLCAPRRFWSAPRAHGSREWARANPVECQPSRLHKSFVRRWRGESNPLGW